MTQPIVGYLTYTKDGITGEPGIAYDYILGGDGVFIRSTNQLLRTVVLVTSCCVRGLKPVPTGVELVHGKIPQALFDLALNTILANHETEIYLAITWKDGYHLFQTNQQGSGAMVSYDCLKDTLMDIHSHPGEIGCAFSNIDDADEQGLRLSCVIGDLEDVPGLRIRVGVYGNFCELKWTDVFEGDLVGAIDTMSLEEVPVEDELPSELPIRGPDPPDIFGWGWGHRLLSGGWPMQTTPPPA